MLFYNSLRTEPPTSVFKDCHKHFVTWVTEGYVNERTLLVDDEVNFILKHSTRNVIYSNMMWEIVTGRLGEKHSRRRGDTRNVLP